MSDIRGDAVKMVRRDTYVCSRENLTLLAKSRARKEELLIGEERKGIARCTRTYFLIESLVKAQRIEIFA
jgi:hypothetical protein